MAPKRSEMPVDAVARDVVKILDHITATGERPNSILEDFLDLSLACMDMLPAQTQAVLASGRTLDDPPEYQKLWHQLRTKYRVTPSSNRKWVFDRFAEALHVLMVGCHKADYEDFIGQIYMVWGSPNNRLGQVFTPLSICKMMGRLMTPEPQVHQALLRAYLACPEGLLHRVMLEDDLAREPVIFDMLQNAAGEWDPVIDVPSVPTDWSQVPGGRPQIRPVDIQIARFVRSMDVRILEFCAKSFKRVEVCDPACGSGNMFLGVAAALPQWMNDYNLVEYHGTDIDGLCVKMAKLNLMLYGLNGYSLRLNVALANGWAEHMQSPIIFEDPPYHPALIIRRDVLHDPILQEV